MSSKYQAVEKRMFTDNVKLEIKAFIAHNVVSHLTNKLNRSSKNTCARQDKNKHE